MEAAPARRRVGLLDSPGAGAIHPRARVGVPAAARALGKRFDEVTDAAARQARRVPGEPRAEGAPRGAAAREQDLPIANYDDLRVAEINSRLSKLSDVDLSKVEAYSTGR